MVTILKNLWNDLKGYKTYIMVFAAIIYAVDGYFLHQISASEMIMDIALALTGAGIRHGISTTADKYMPLLEQLSTVLINNQAAKSATPATE